MTGMEKIGVVTVLYKSETVLNDFFRTLNEQSYKNINLYVIDNKSPDDSLKKCRDLAKNVWFETKIIENDDNYGVAKGNNQGIEAALKDNCDFVLLSNNDIVLRSDTIERLYIGLKNNNADMTVPKIYFWKTNLIWAAGGKFVWYTGINRHFGYKRIDNGQFDYDKKIDYAPTCLMLLKKEVFATVGMMDEKYFVYYDDADFSYRAKVNEQKLFFIYDSIVEHKEGTSTGGVKSDFTIYYMNRNRIYFAKKNQRFYYFYLIENLLYHFLFRWFTMIKNRHQWRLILKALYDGIKY